MKRLLNQKLVQLIIFICLANLVFLTGGLSQNKESIPKLRQEVVKLKYTKAQAVQNLLMVFYGPNTRIGFNSQIPDVLTIVDLPENVEKILEAIKKIDVKPRDLLFTVQIVLGSEAEGKINETLKDDPLIRELQKLLRYKSYSMLDVAMVRAMDREESGLAFGQSGQFQLLLKPVITEESPQGNIKIELYLRQLSGMWYEGQRAQPTTLISSNLNLRSGDRTVVGVSRLDGGDKGLILIISGKILD
jgi:type II secretory pathway component GspD/PulD (secretin)